MFSDILESDAVMLIAGILAVLGAANWATIEFLEFDVLSDLLELSAGTTEYSVVVGAIGVAALIEGYAVLYYRLGEGS